MQVKKKKDLVETKSRFSEKLTRFMEKVGATQADGAAAMGVTDTTFQNYVYGKTYPAVDKVEMLAKQYGYSPKWFFQDEVEITVEDVKKAVMVIEKALAGKELEDQKKALLTAVTARALAREIELGQAGDLEERINKFVRETLSLLQ